MLMIVCTACFTPLIVPKVAENFLMGSSHIQCSVCREWSEVDQEIKNHLRKEKGMQPL